MGVPLRTRNISNEWCHVTLDTELRVLRATSAKLRSQPRRVGNASIVQFSNCWRRPLDLRQARSCGRIRWAYVKKWRPALASARAAGAVCQQQRGHFIFLKAKHHASTRDVRRNKSGSVNIVTAIRSLMPRVSAKNWSQTQSSADEAFGSSGTCSRIIKWSFFEMTPTAPWRRIVCMHSPTGMHLHNLKQKITYCSDHLEEPRHHQRQQQKKRQTHQNGQPRRKATWYYCGNINTPPFWSIWAVPQT